MWMLDVEVGFIPFPTSPYDQLVLLALCATTIGHKHEPVREVALK